MKKEQIKGFNKFYKEVVKKYEEEDSPVFNDSKVTWKGLKQLFTDGKELKSKKRVYQLKFFIKHYTMFKNIQLEGLR
jgi:hypothetical protein